jgi:hypothetical protein
MKRLFVILALLGLAPSALAELLGNGIWVQRGKAAAQEMTIETVGSARKITYRFRGPDGKWDDKNLVTITTALDGKDAPIVVNGKPTAQTMAVQRVDANHTSTVLKSSGKPYGISRAEISPDGKVMKVENEITDPIGGPVGKRTDYWDRK